jgi:hypothetical protein
MAKRKSFTSRKQGTYTVSYISGLREKVAITCNVLEPTRYFDFKTSKQSNAYRELDNLLSAYGYPELSDGTYYNFFTKSPNIDELDNEYYSFQERTIDIFQDFVDRFYALPIQNNVSIPTLSKAIQDNTGLDKTIKKLLHTMYTRINGKVSGGEVIQVDKNGAGILTICETIEAITDITHIMPEYRVFNSGKIKMLSAVNTETNQELQVYTNYEQEDYHGFFIIFDEMVKKGTSISYKLVVYLENFFDELLTNRLSHVDRRPGVFLKYQTLKETYIFPKIPVFEDIEVRIKRHPNAELIDKLIKPVSKNGFNNYIIDHGDLTNFNVEIVIHFKKVGK